MAFGTATVDASNSARVTSIHPELCYQFLSRFANRLSHFWVVKNLKSTYNRGVRTAADTLWVRLLELAMLLILAIAIIDVWTDCVDAVLALSSMVVLLTLLGFAIRPRNLTDLRLEPAEAICTETIALESFGCGHDSPLVRIAHF